MVLIKIYSKSKPTLLLLVLTHIISSFCCNIMARSACKGILEHEILEILPIRNRLGLWSPFLVEENIGSCCCAGLFAFTLHSAHSGAVHILSHQLQQLTNWQNIVFWFLYIIAIMLIYSSSQFFYDVLSKSNLLFQLGRPDITDSANFRTISK